MNNVIIVICTLLSCCCGQSVKFPPEEPASSQINIQNRNQQQATAPLADYQQAKTSYDKFIDDIITKGVTDLGFNVHRSAKNLNYNLNKDYVVYSPISIASVLYLLLLGSSGQTFSELCQFLGISNGVNVASNSIKVHSELGELIDQLEANATDGNLVKFANGLFVQNDYPVRQQYVDTSANIYQSEVMNLDFRGNSAYAKDVINNWTSAKTFGKIENILKENPVPDTKLVLVSSVYFKADWSIPFDSSLTSLQTFYPNGKSQPSKIKFQMMANAAQYLYHNDSYLNCEIVGLPYKGYQFTYYVIIPHGSNKDRLAQLENRLTYNEVKRLTASVVYKDILVAIPKMKLTSNLQLNEILQNNGLRSLFDPREANLAILSNIDGTTPQYLSSSSNSGIGTDEPFIFSRAKQAPDTDDADRKRKKRENGNDKIGKIRNENRGTRVIGPNRFDNNLDSLRHFLTKESRNNPGLYVNKVLHKVVIDVNEKGTEAAAATAGAISKSGKTVVKADVPFLFFIMHEESQMILFWGSVITPSPSFSN